MDKDDEDEERKERTRERRRIIRGGFVELAQMT